MATVVAVISFSVLHRRNSMKGFVKIAAFCIALLCAQSAFAFADCSSGACSAGAFSPVRSGARTVGRVGFQIVRRAGRIAIVPVRIVGRAAARRVEKRQNGELPRQRAARFVFGR